MTMAAAIMTVLIAIVAREAVRQPVVSLPSASAAVPALVPVATASARAVVAVATATGDADATEARREMVVLRGSTSGHSGRRALRAGATVGESEAVVVPAGGRLVLAFSVEQAVVSPELGLTLEGPASARIARDGVILDAGKGRVISEASMMRVRGPHVVAYASHASWTVDVEGDRTRLRVTRGQVELASEDGRTRSIHAGEEATCEGSEVITTQISAPAPPHPLRAAESTPEAYPAPPVDPGVYFVAAEQALNAGNRAGAENAFLAFLAGATASDARRHRASFRLAELELARGLVAAARPRLVSVMKGADPALAEDAAVLLARVSEVGNRADVWAAYADVAASGEHRARARLEEARARAARGDRPGAARAARLACAERGPSCDQARRFLE